MRYAKRCTKCDVEKIVDLEDADESEFHLRVRERKDGSVSTRPQARCKTCANNFRGGRRQSPRIDPEPFRRWMGAYMAERGLTAHGAGESLEVTPRRVTALMAGEMEHVTFDTVDRALTNCPIHVDVDGRTIWEIGDLYPVEDVLAA